MIINRHPRANLGAAAPIGVLKGVERPYKAYMGRARIVTIAMSTTEMLSLLVEWTAGSSALFATLLELLRNAAIYFDGSAMTAWTLQAFDKGKQQ